jgi:UTP:GlnB (protein PII) uridylyltransferase
VEVFMRAYYLHAATVSRLTTLVAHRLTDCDKPLFGGKYVFGRTVREGVRLSRGHLTVTKPELIESRREYLLRIFDDAQKNGCPLNHETREALRRHAPLIDDEFRREPPANEIFFSILKWKEGVYETLLDMHRTGVLGAFIPEFG